MTGSIPHELGQLTDLNSLYLHSNRLSGAIPLDLGNLNGLTILWIADNELTGTIPSELAELTNLQRLGLGDNQLSGCIPAGLRGVQDNELARLNLPHCDVLLNGLSVTPADLRPGFDSYVTDYTAAATASSVTVSPVVQNSATFQYLDQNNRVLADADGTQPGHQVDVPVGTVTTIRVRVTTGDGLESRDYTIEVTGLGGLAAPSIRPGDVRHRLTISFVEGAESDGWR